MRGLAEPEPQDPPKPPQDPLLSTERVLPGADVSAPVHWATPQLYLRAPWLDRGETPSIVRWYPRHDPGMKEPCPRCGLPIASKEDYETVEEGYDTTPPSCWGEPHCSERVKELPEKLRAEIAELKAELAGKRFASELVERARAAEEHQLARMFRALTGFTGMLEATPMEVASTLIERVKNTELNLATIVKGIEAGDITLIVGRGDMIDWGWSHAKSSSTGVVGERARALLIEQQLVTTWSERAVRAENEAKKLQAEVKELRDEVLVAVRSVQEDVRKLRAK